MLLELVAWGELDRGFAPGELCSQIAGAVQQAETEDELGRVLRRQRTRQQVRIIWRDLTRQADLVQTCRDLSDMADASIDQAYQWLYQRHCAQFGTPTGRRSGEAQHMVILGMGKLGAVELNLSSDIDLIFAYPEGGETVGVKRSLDNQEFFIRLGQKLIKALDPMTVDGFVFRVDMRLRPYGSAGALVLSFNALEQYYQDQGRDWERYAMIKARVVGGDQDAGQRLLELLRPFVYRRYLDFSAIEALRSMKQLIQQEVRRKGMSENIKLGAGGIREVEFIAQAFQLIHGGRDLSLQQRPLLRVLATLEGQGYLPPQVIAELREGYQFLRYAEHALQAIDDRQTQMLPEDELSRIRVAFIMGFANWSAFHEAINHWRERVDWHFRQVIADPDEDESGENEGATPGAEWLPLPATGRGRVRRAGGGLQAAHRPASRQPGARHAAPGPRAPGRLRPAAAEHARRAREAGPDPGARAAPGGGGGAALGLPGTAHREPRRPGAPADAVRGQPDGGRADRQVPHSAGRAA
jgi:glutamate-ammonia-ligase adenylyltransferase